MVWFGVLEVGLDSVSGMGMLDVYCEFVGYIDITTRGCYSDTIAGSVVHSCDS